MQVFHKFICIFVFKGHVWTEPIVHMKKNFEKHDYLHCGKKFHEIGHAETKELLSIQKDG